MWTSVIRVSWSVDENKFLKPSREWLLMKYDWLITGPHMCLFQPLHHTLQLRIDPPHQRFTSSPLESRHVCMVLPLHHIYRSCEHQEKIIRLIGIHWQKQCSNITKDCYGVFFMSYTKKMTAICGERTVYSKRCKIRMAIACCSTGRVLNKTEWLWWYTWINSHQPHTSRSCVGYI